MLVRPAQTSDLTGALQVLTSAGLPLSGVFVAARIAAAQAGDGWTIALVAEDEARGRIAGGAALEVTPSLTQHDALGRMMILAVHADYRRQGVGTELMAAIEQAAWQHDCGRIEIVPGFHRAEARAFYASLGYRVLNNRLLKRRA